MSSPPPRPSEPATPAPARYGSDVIVDLPASTASATSRSTPGRASAACTTRWSTARGAPELIYLPAREAGREPGPRLRQGERRADGRHPARHRRPPPREPGHLHWPTRSRAGARPGRRRPGGHGAPPAVDRLDPYLQHPGQRGPQLHQVGRPAGLGRGHARGVCPRLPRSSAASRPGPSTWPWTPTSRSSNSRTRCRASRPRGMPPTRPIGPDPVGARGAGRPPRGGRTAGHRGRVRRPRPAGLHLDPRARRAARRGRHRQRRPPEPALRPTRRT